MVQPDLSSLSMLCRVRESTETTDGRPVCVRCIPGRGTRDDCPRLAAVRVRFPL